MAYKNNLLEYYGGGSVPYRQGYRSGGMALLNRTKNIKKAADSLRDKSKTIAKKGLFSSIGSIVGGALGKKIGSKFLAGALAPIFGPASPIIAEMITAGGGAYLGAKAGYGKQVGIDPSGWLAGDKEKANQAQLGEEAFREYGLAAGLTAGVQGIMKSDTLKDIGDSFKQKINLKPDVGGTPMGGMSSSGLPSGGDLSKTYAGSPKGYGGLPGAETFKYNQAASGFGRGEKALGGKSLLGTTDFANQLQSTGEHFASGKFMEGWSPTIIEAWQNRINEGIEPAKDLASEPSYGNPYLLGAIGSQEGGMVRDDMALLDMIYRR